MSEAPTLVSRRAPNAKSTLPEPPEMKIFGPPLNDLIAVPTSHLGLLCGYGESESRPVLVPYLQLRLLSATESEDEEEGLELSEAFAATLAYDNAAFLIMDLIRDFRTSAARLRAFSSGELKPEPVRLTQAKQYLERAKTMIDTAVAQLDGILAESPPVATSKPTPPRTRPKPKPKPKAAPTPKT